MTEGQSRICRLVSIPDFGLRVAFGWRSWFVGPAGEQV